MGRFKDAVYEQTEKVFTAFVTWGIGMLLMGAYCAFIYWLNNVFGLYGTIAGAMIFLTAAYFMIDLWWNFKRAGFKE